jgi:ribosomal protein L23
MVKPLILFNEVITKNSKSGIKKKFSDFFDVETQNVWVYNPVLKEMVIIRQHFYLQTGYRKLYQFKLS